MTFLKEHYQLEYFQTYLIRFNKFKDNPLSFNDIFFLYVQTSMEIHIPWKKPKTTHANTDWPPMLFKVEKLTSWYQQNKHTKTSKQKPYSNSDKHLMLTYMVKTFQHLHRNYTSIYDDRGAIKMFICCKYLNGAEMVKGLGKVGVRDINIRSY